MSSFIIKALNAGMGVLGASMLINAWKPFYPESLQFFGTEEPLIGALLFINAIMLGYAFHEDEEAQWYAKQDIAHVQRQLNANRSRCCVGILLLLAGVSTLLMARKQDETSPLGWFCYFAMLCAGAYLAGSGGSHLLKYDDRFMVLRAISERVYLSFKRENKGNHAGQSQRPEPVLQSGLVNFMYRQHRKRVDAKLREQRDKRAREALEESHSPSW